MVEYIQKKTISLSLMIFSQLSYLTFDINYLIKYFSKNNIN